MVLRGSAVILSSLLFGSVGCGGLIDVPAPPPVVASTNGRTTVELAFAAPIPVGHRVVVRWYRSADGETKPYEPIVEDVDTGVVYASDAWFDTPGIRRRGTPTPVGGLRAGVTEHSIARGRVASCRVISLSWGSATVQTTIVLAPGDDAPAT